MSPLERVIRLLVVIVLAILFWVYYFDWAE